MNSFHFLFIPVFTILVFFVEFCHAAGGKIGLELGNARSVSDCTQGQITNIKYEGFSVYVTMCGENQQKYSFKHYIVDVKPNPKYPFVAVYTSSYHNKYPNPKDKSVFPDEMFIISTRKKTKYHYKPAKTPDCHYDLWSPEGTYAAFCGGIDIVKHEQLENYLLSDSGIYRVVNINKNRSNDYPAQNMEVVGWQSENELIITNGCCGDIWKTEYNLKTDSFRRLECAYGYCMCKEDAVFSAMQKDIVIDSGNLVKFEVYHQLNVFFGNIGKHCFNLDSVKSMPDLKGEFFITLSLDNKVGVNNAKVNGFKTSSTWPDSTQVKSCLENAAKKLVFKDNQGTKSLSFRVMFGDKKGRCRF